MKEDDLFGAYCVELVGIRHSGEDNSAVRLTGGLYGVDEMHSMRFVH